MTQLTCTGNGTNSARVIDADNDAQVSIFLCLSLSTSPLRRHSFKIWTRALSCPATDDKDQLRNSHVNKKNLLGQQPGGI
jgi:hypothetical protein